MLTMLNPWLIVCALVAAAVIAAGAGKLGYDFAEGKCKAAQLERAELVAELRSANLALADGIAARTETAIGQIRVENTTINREVRHERTVHTKVLENPDCAVPASTVGVLNRARGIERGHDRPAAGEPGGAVPAAPAAAGREAAPAR